VDPDAIAVRIDLGHRVGKVEELAHVHNLEQAQDVAVARDDRGGVEPGGAAGFVQQRQFAERGGVEVGHAVEVEHRALGIRHEVKRLAQLMF